MRSDSGHSTITLFIFSIGVCAFAALIGALALSGRAVADDTVDALVSEADSAVQQQESGTSSPSIEETSFILADQLTHEYKMSQEKIKLYICILLAVFALVALIIVLRVLNSRKDCTATHLTNASGLVFIIFGTLFLILLADLHEQLNAGVGILGAVAGYLFGTMRKKDLEEKPAP
ncbi:MAG: hypothetical protein GWO11_03315 [Desulfuromonadales bacterium]|nr:hypothetical protein [Desulfuromonadales bacterium]NIS43085.1 hypothetical protein [Desulfuromonadales bacterium]